MSYRDEILNLPQFYATTAHPLSNGTSTISASERHVLIARFMAVSQELALNIAARADAEIAELRKSLSSAYTIAAAPQPRVGVSEEMCERVSYAFAHQDYSGSEITPMDRRKSDARLYLRLWQAELGPALGLVSREHICELIKATDDAASAHDYMLDSDDCIAVIRGELGPSNYPDTAANITARDVMGVGSELSR